MKGNFLCPVRATANVFAAKWKVEIVWHLSYEPKRFGELRRMLEGVSEKVLTAQLRELESDGVVARSVVGVAPSQVTYRLTAAGDELLPAMELMCGWGKTYLGVEPTLPPRPALVAAG